MIASQLIAIAIGGAFGSVMRYLLSIWVHSFAGRGFPWGTLAVNVLGCLIMGVLFALLAERTSNGVLRAGLLIGVLGGFTTFSAFSIETVNLMIEGALAKAAINMAASLGLCVAATWIGLIAGRNL